jgi:cell division GTPase FtsZ
MAKEKGITTVAVVTFPAVNIEGEAAYENALKSYENYKKYADSICVVDNEKLIGGAKHTLTLEEEFTKSNEEVGEIVKDIVDIVATGSQVNIDLADLKNFLKSNKLLNHITIKIPNEDYSADHVTEIIDIRIKTASLKNNFSTKHVNILLNARFSANSPASIINDVKNALTEISQTDHVNIL